MRKYNLKRQIAYYQGSIVALDKIKFFAEECKPSIEVLMIRDKIAKSIAEYREMLKGLEEDE